MADNTPFLASTDPASPKIADDEVAYSGDSAKVQIVQLGFVSGPEGSRTVAKLADFSVTLASMLTEILAQGVDFDTFLTRLPTALTSNGGALKVGASEVTITQSVAIGATTPAAGADLAGLRNWGIKVPNTFDGSIISFTMCDTLGGTYVPVRDITNTPVTMTVTADNYYDVPGELMGIRFLKIVCGTVQATTTTDFVIVGKS